MSSYLRVALKGLCALEQVEALEYAVLAVLCLYVYHRALKPLLALLLLRRGEYVVQFFAGSHHLFNQYSGK